MPCEKCESKMRSLVTPNVSRDGSKRQVGVNKLVEIRGNRNFNDVSKGVCKICKTQLRINGKYCPSAYREGKCNICGKKMIDLSGHNMSMV
ncbi:cysteine-rich PDZ-binding protein, putative (CRIPT) [Babesia microti strain RI]|uniref:Cysteine-rich PDZ-binding protein n=1 Tax=Babesia microti (strain RI) TaxID=1133968 RepID=I7IHH7_BABMR|nr:cysteine-rich PDZ-binding protein, putative (CRIPT) [Babesia microti strain RI]CCF75832.1 cysteine-rich PDZ-binding protein, putative (CRIPT) [Babesia microti strain RI]|eukprot:XP_012650240.1 cysteine-rich PDZ-binding protein, putative (CRIPT) [Babesia microti strain RI]